MTFHSSDRELVLAFQAGERRAYEYIDAKYRPTVTRICKRLLINHDDVEEAIQETMTRVFKGLGTFNGRYLLEAWIARIATNVCLDVIRKVQRRPTNVGALFEDGDERLVRVGRIVPPAVLASAAEDPIDVVERADERRRVLDMLKQLPENHRDALVLREFEGYSHEQIAEALGLTPPKAKALLHRAKRSFRAAWAGESFANGPRALIPLLVLVRFAGRFTDKAPGVDVSSAVQTASTAVTTATASTAIQTAVNTVATVASSPVVQQSVYSAGDRVAAGVTALVAATTIGMGATVVGNKVLKPPPKPKAVLVDDRVKTEPADPTTQSEVWVDPAVSPSASPEPSPDPSPSPSESPSASETPGTSPAPVSNPGAEPQPSASPSAEPSPTPSPTTRPAPAHVFGMRSDIRSDGSCGCDETSTVEYSSTDGSAGKRRTGFNHVVTGPVLDGEGDSAWWVRLEYWGSMDQYTGRMNVAFTLRQGEHQWVYEASATAASGTRNAEGGTRYVFDGDYRLRDGQVRGDIPQYGSLQILVDWWEDGTTIYRTSAALVETG